MTSITEIVVRTPILQAEHLAPRPGYLALAVDGATPQSRFGRLHRRRHSGTDTDGGIPAQLPVRVVGWLIPIVPPWDSNRVRVRLQYRH